MVHGKDECRATSGMADQAEGDWVAAVHGAGASIGLALGQTVRRALTEAEAGKIMRFTLILKSGHSDDSELDRTDPLEAWEDEDGEELSTKEIIAAIRAKKWKLREGDVIEMQLA